MTPVLRPHYMVIALATLLACVSTEKKGSYDTHQTETLIIEQVSDHVFVHTTYLESEQFGKVACNGMIVADNGEAVVIDTPSDDAGSAELIDWIENKLKCKVVGVVATHFHIDCLGGLPEFHKRGITSYANNETIRLAYADSVPLPQNGFENRSTLQAGNITVINQFAGVGHTHDNIVCYVPSDSVLFGGCLIKTMGGTRGNLADADTTQWSATVHNVKATFHDARRVIPGHGKSGGQELLDYTAKMFATTANR